MLFNCSDILSVTQLQLQTLMSNVYTEHVTSFKTTVLSKNRLKVNTAFALTVQFAVNKIIVSVYAFKWLIHLYTSLAFGSTRYPNFQIRFSPKHKK